MLITGTPVTCTKADFELLIKVGNIILFTAITHIWFIYTFIIDYLHENNILMLAIHFGLRRLKNQQVEGMMSRIIV